MMKKVIVGIVIAVLVIIGIIFCVNHSSLNTKDYTVLNDFTVDHDFQYARRGIYEEGMKEADKGYRFIIAAGEKETEGFDISIKKVEYDSEHNAIVTVKETVPSSTATEAVSYPICAIDFTEEPKSLTVKTTEEETFENISLCIVSIKSEGNQWNSLKVDADMEDLDRLITLIKKGKETDKTIEDIVFKIEFSDGTKIEGAEKKLYHIYNEKTGTDKMMQSSAVGGLYDFLKQLFE